MLNEVVDVELMTGEDVDDVVDDSFSPLVGETL